MNTTRMSPDDLKTISQAAANLLHTTEQVNRSAAEYGEDRSNVLAAIFADGVVDVRDAWNAMRDVLSVDEDPFASVWPGPIALPSGGYAASMHSAIQTMIGDALWGIMMHIWTTAVFGPHPPKPLDRWSSSAVPEVSSPATVRIEDVASPMYDAFMVYVPSDAELNQWQANRRQELTRAIRELDRNVASAPAHHVGKFPRLFPHGPVDADDIVNFVVAVDAERAKPAEEQRTQLQIAIEICKSLPNRDVAAKRLISRARKARLKGKVNY